MAKKGVFDATQKSIYPNALSHDSLGRNVDKC